MHELLVQRYEMVLGDDGSIRGTVKLLEKRKLENLKKYGSKRRRKGEGQACAV